MPFMPRTIIKTILITASILVILGIGAYFLSVYLLRPTPPPQEFLDARSGAAEISRQIVSLTQAVNSKIKEVNLSDFSGNPDRALQFIREARSKNSEAYSKAFKLAQYLQKMAEAMGKIKSVENQRLTYEAVAVELSLTSEFIIYTQNLNIFLDNLARAIATDSLSDRRAVQISLQEVNRGIAQVNALNNEFLSKMNILDAAMRIR